MLVSHEDVLSAWDRVKPYLHQTPLASSAFFSNMAGAPCRLKLENFQKTGSFKARGAFNAALSVRDKGQGIATASSGNHGQAAAYAGRTLGINVTVVVAKDVSAAKVSAIREYGARVVYEGTTTADRQKKAQEIAAEEGLLYLPSFDDPFIVAGQGTCAVEILNQDPNVQVFFVPVGGGGLISGVSLIKEKHPNITVIGVEPKLSASMKASLTSGHVVEVFPGDTIADGLKALKPGQLTFEITERYVDDIITVTDEEIIWVLKMLLERMKILAEPSGAVAVAGMLKWRNRLQKRKPAAIVSGGNIDLLHLADLMKGTQGRTE